MRGSNSSGNGKFVEEIYQKYKKLMFFTAGKYTANLSDQEDIVQTALERLLKIFSKQDTSDCCISANYIVFTIRSVAIDFLRKQGRESEHLISIENEQVEAMAKTDGSLDDLLLSLERSERLKDLWKKLPEVDRIVLEGKYIFDLTDQELAGILKCKPSGIRMKLTRARRRAAKLLSERTGDLM